MLHSTPVPCRVVHRRRRCRERLREQLLVEPAQTRAVVDLRRLPGVAVARLPEVEHRVLQFAALLVQLGEQQMGRERVARRTERELLSAFVDHVLSFVDVDSIRPMRVVADVANGMGGLVVPAVFERLPMIELEVMYPELDGTFPNHPADPLQPANQRDLRARVVSGEFDLGLAFFNGAGGSDAFNNLSLLNNRIRVPADLNATFAPADVNQNIGIHYSFGTNQTIQGNQIDIVGDGVSDGISAPITATT